MVRHHFSSVLVMMAAGSYSSAVRTCSGQTLASHGSRRKLTTATDLMTSSASSVAQLLVSPSSSKDKACALSSSSSPSSCASRGVSYRFLLLALVLAWMCCTADAANRILRVTVADEAVTRRDHRTHLYRTTQYLVVRRGAPIIFNVQADAPLDEGQALAIQASPSFIFDPSTAVVTQIRDGNYELKIEIPVTAPVGTHLVGIRLSDKGNVVALNRRLAVIFNPYHEGDNTYYPNHVEREEYLNNESGITYRGATRSIQAVRWYYGQFIPESIRSALYYVDKLPENDRRDPVRVIRHLTATLTNQPEHPDGMMMGRWSRDFPGGMNPNAWVGSDRIVQQFVRSGFQTVKYAQCWVFAAVLNTVARAMGFPIRQISNFDSAHEMPEVPGEYKQEIVRYWERNSRRMMQERGQIWNFHSWNEVFLKNPNLPEPYNSARWHAVDSTPQEMSGGKFQLGPAPLQAVKDWKVTVPHDVDFVTSEVSARIRNLMVSCWGGCQVVGDMGHDAHVPTGTIVVTKSVGSWAQNIITSLYHNRVFSAPNISPLLGPAGNGMMRVLSADSDPSASADGIAAGGMPSRRRRRMALNSLFSQPGVINMDTMSLAEARTATNTINVPLDVDEHAAEYAAAGQPLNRMEGHFSTVMNNLDDSVTSPDTVVFSSSPLLPPIIDNSSPELRRSIDTSRPHSGNAARDEMHNPGIRHDRRTPTGSASVSLTSHDAEISETEIPVYRYRDSGIVMSLNVVPAELGKPLEVYVVFSCAGVSPFTSYEDIRSGRAGPIRRVSLHSDRSGMADDDSVDEHDILRAGTAERTTTTFSDNSATSPASSSPSGAAGGEGSAPKCPERVMLSFRLLLKFSLYTGDDLETIGDVSSRVVLQKENNFNQIFRFTSNNYLRRSTFPVSEFVRATVMATDHSSDPNRDIVLFGSHCGTLSLPTLNVLSNRDTIRTSMTTDMAREGVVLPATPQTDVTVQIGYRNVMPFELTNATLELSADNMGFPLKVVDLKSVPSGSAVAYVHTFSASTALAGNHTYQAVLMTNELPPMMGSVSFQVTPTHADSSGMTDSGAPAS